MKSGHFKDLAFLALVVLGVVVIFSNLYYIVLDDRPQSWDPALHLTYSYIYFNLIKSFQFGSIIEVSNYYPPFFHLSSIPLYFLFGFSEDIAIITNLVYYLILIYSVFRIGEMLKDKTAGLISSSVVSIFPVLIKFQRIYMIDFALTALTALAVYLYLKSDDLRNLKYSILFGFVVGISELTKWNAFIYIFPAVISISLVNYFTKCPYCHQVVTNGLKYNLRKFCSKKHLKLYESKKRNFSILGNVLLSITVALFSSAWWYLPNLRITLARLTYFANIGGKEGDPTFLTFQGWIYYADALLEHLGLFFSILFLSSLYHLFKRDRRIFTVVLVSFAVTYAILTILSNKDPRYVMPLLPIIAISIGIFVEDLIGSRAGKVLMTLILALGILNISALTFGQPAIDNKIFPSPDYPRKEDWKIYDLLETIKSSGGEGKIAVVLSDHPYLNGQSLNFYRLIGNYKFAVYNGVYIGYETFVQNFDKISYVILIEPREHTGVYGDIEKRLYEFFYNHTNEFEEIAEFSLPDDTTVLVYKRI